MMEIDLKTWPTGRLSTMVGRLARSVGAGLVLLAMAVRPANATVTEVYGGPGGGQFNLTCPANAVLVGFQARAGAWVDAVGIICAPLDVASHRPSASRKVQGWAGGNGGSPQESYCARGEFLTGVGVAHTRGNNLPRQYVNTIGLACGGRSHIDRCISSGEGCGWIPPVVRGPVISVVKEYSYDSIVCPAGEVAVGVVGRSGKYVDALGLVCRELGSGAVRGR